MCVVTSDNLTQVTLGAFIRLATNLQTVLYTTFITGYQSIAAFLLILLHARDQQCENATEAVLWKLRLILDLGMLTVNTEETVSITTGAVCYHIKGVFYQVQPEFIFWKQAW
jgi:hypothetical protein